MPLTQRQQQDVLILCPGQKVTASEAGEELSKAVLQGLEGGTLKFLFDFSAVEFMDSLGVGQIVASYTAIKNRGGRLILCGLRPRIMVVLRMASLHLVLEIQDSGPDEVIWE